MSSINGRRVAAWLLPLTLICSASVAGKDGTTVTTDLGSGIKVDLPSDWQLSGMANIATRQPEFRKLGIKAYEWRVDTGTMRIAFSYMMFPGSESAEIDTDSLKDTVRKASLQYLPAAMESAVEPTSFSKGGVIGVYATLHAKPDSMFPVFSGRAYRCVTTAVVRRGAGAISISIGSADCDSAEHRTALAAVIGLHE